MVILYGKIFIVAKQQALKIENTGSKAESESYKLRVAKRERKAAKTLGVTVVAFMISWLPYTIDILIDAFMGFITPAYIYEICCWGAYYNSAMNPLIYALFYPWFRKAMKVILTGGLLNGSSSTISLFLEWMTALSWISSVQFSHSVVSDSLRPHKSQHARPPCPSSTPGVHSDSRPSSWWCHPAISSSVVPFSSCPQSLPSSEHFPMSQLFTWGGQSTGVSVLASFLPKKSQGWSPLEWTGWISLQCKGLSRIFSNTTVQKHQFFGVQLSL